MLLEKKLLARIFTAVVGIPIILVSVYLGGVPFLLLIVSLAYVCLYEFLHLARGPKTEDHYLDIFSYIITAGLIALAYMPETRFVWQSPFIEVCAFIVVGYFLAQLFTEKVYFRGNAFKDSVRGIFYIGFFFPFFVLIREFSEKGMWLTVFLIFLVWTNDTAAYFFGKKWGRHALNKHLSPHKTFEGAIGGFLSTLVFAYFVGPSMGFFPNQALFVGGGVSIFSQLGDLLESLFKRAEHAKDSSSILPGHGGFLDRMDSFVLTGAVYYFFLLFLNK